MLKYKDDRQLRSLELTKQGMFARSHHLLRVLILLALVVCPSVCSFPGEDRDGELEGVERSQQRGLRGSIIDVVDTASLRRNREAQYEYRIDENNNDATGSNFNGWTSSTGRILQNVPGVLPQATPGATIEDPIGLWHVSPEDIEKYAPPLLGGKNMNYGASSAAKAAELATRAAAGVQTGVVTAGSNNILPSVGHRHGHHVRPGGVDIFALARRKKIAMEAKAAASGITGSATAGIAEMPGKGEDEKMKHVPASFDEFDGKTGEFLKSSNTHFPTTTTHHGAKDDQYSGVAATTAAIGGGGPATEVPPAPVAPVAGAPVALAAPTAR